MATLTITVSTGGTTVPWPGIHEYAAGSVVSGITAFPDAGYTFNHWLLDGVQLTSNPITIIMDRNHTLDALFSGSPPPTPTTYKLTVTSTIGGATEPPVGIYTYNVGDEAVIRAVSYPGYTFDSWQLDGVVITDNPFRLTMDGDHSLHATFKQEAEPVTPVLLVGVTPELVLAGVGITAATCLAGALIYLKVTGGI